MKNASSGMWLRVDLVWTDVSEESAYREDIAKCNIWGFHSILHRLFCSKSRLSSIHACKCRYAASIKLIPLPSTSLHIRHLSVFLPFDAIHSRCINGHEIYHKHTVHQVQICLKASKIYTASEGAVRILFHVSFIFHDEQISFHIFHPLIRLNNNY
jgi:hypothetical protein